MIAAGLELDRINDLRTITAVGLAMNGTAEQIAQFIGRAPKDDIDMTADALAAFGLREEP